MQEELKQHRNQCYTCMRPVSTCICNLIKPLTTNTRFVILMHPKEYKKQKNGTGYMTNLQLDNAEIIVGVDFNKHSRVNGILSDQNNASFLLYPGKESFNLSTSNSTEMNDFMGLHPYLFILDGTWPCARKMLKLSKNLQQLKRVSFNNSIKSKFIIKQQPEPLCLSTIESVYTVLNLLKAGGLENCDASKFLVPFEKMIKYQMEYCLNPDSKNYSPMANKKITPKNQYKKNTQRSTILKT